MTSDSLKATSLLKGSKMQVWWKKVKARKPMQAWYMRQMRWSLLFIAAWPGQALGEEKCISPAKYRAFQIALLVTTYVAGLAYLKIHFKEFDLFDIGNNLINSLMNTISLQRLTVAMFSIYSAMTKDFINKIHLIHHKHNCEYSMKMYERVNKICTMIATILISETPVGIIFYNVMPMYENYSNGMYQSQVPANQTFQHAVYYALPFNDSTNFFGYFIVTIINWIISFYCSLYICAMDFYLCTIIMHVWGHLKILGHSLRNIFKPATTKVVCGISVPWYDEEENKRVAKILKDCIKRHAMLLRFMKKTTAAFGPMLFLYSLFQQCCLCILLVECSKLEAKTTGKHTLLAWILFQQLIQISFTVELLGTQSESLMDAVYSVPWESLDTSNRRTVIIFLQNAQKPVVLNAMGMVPVGVKTMANILKTTISYFMLLRTLADEE